nr:hypothetical protein [Synergistales bacterium]
MSERNLLISGGSIYTCDTEKPLAEAVLVSGNRIICLGDREKVEAHPASIDPVRLDLEGNTLLPGFSDSHLHLRSVAKQGLALDLNPAKSLPEVL